MTRADGRPLWRGQVQHAASGRSLFFQSLEELLEFVQKQTGELEEKGVVDASERNKDIENP